MSQYGKRVCKCLGCGKTANMEQYHRNAGCYYRLPAGWYLTGSGCEFNDLSETVCQSCIDEDSDDSEDGDDPGM